MFHNNSRSQKGRHNKGSDYSKSGPSGFSGNKSNRASSNLSGRGGGFNAPSSLQNREKNRSRFGNNFGSFSPNKTKARYKNEEDFFSNSSEKYFGNSAKPYNKKPRKFSEESSNYPTNNWSQNGDNRGNSTRNRNRNFSSDREHFVRHPKTSGSKKQAAKNVNSAAVDSAVSHPENFWIYGKHPVLAALQHNKRKFYQLLVTKDNQAELENFLAAGVISKNAVNIVDDQKIAAKLPANALHQGFALCSSPTEFINENNFLQKISAIEKEKLPKILILDQLTDPHNIGAIIRSAVAFGIKNIVITKNHFPVNSAIVNKSSSGMVELADLIAVGNLNNFLLRLKQLGYWCSGLDGSNDNPQKTVDLAAIKTYQPLALIIGSEGEGIRNLVRQNCDLLIRIPTDPQVESLNASNAAAIALYSLYVNAT